MILASDKSARITLFLRITVGGGFNNADQYEGDS